MMRINTEIKQTINCGGRLVNLSQPVVMGIINNTPDSFYAGSRCQTEQTIINRIAQIVDEGGTFVDVGAYSSRPNAVHISEDEELERLLLVIGIIKKHFPGVLLSVDTFRASLVEKVFDRFGAFVVNDISAGELDKDMFATVARLQLPYIAMHMKGTPQTMAQEVTYTDFVQEVIDYFVDKVTRLNELGVADIIIDPGFGFAKTTEHNYRLLYNMDELQIFGRPILAGVSRKGMIYKPLGITAADALNGTTVVNTLALLKGAAILRVHDVKEAVQAIRIVQQYNG